MKVIKFLLTFFIIAGGIVYGVYYFGLNFVSGKVADSVYTELENSGQLNEIKQLVKNDPEVKHFLESGANVDESKLPFKSKEQATRVLIKKIGFNELQNIQAKYQNGMSESDVLELLSEFEGKLTNEEILALKVIAYKELYK